MSNCNGKAIFMNWVPHLTMISYWFLGTNGPVKFLKVPLGCLDPINFYGMLESLLVIEEIQYLMFESLFLFECLCFSCVTFKHLIIYVLSYFWIAIASAPRKLPDVLLSSASTCIHARNQIPLRIHTQAIFKIFGSIKIFSFQENPAVQASKDTAANFAQILGRLEIDRHVRSALNMTRGLRA